ncbi:MAG TPA: SpoIIE family protein phosphatase [Candidatus Baltobacteraceae bacterium]|nr:SpoIIE family protein phosphatase [Candidatus Baltobacteraceae bacterium]
MAIHQDESVFVSSSPEMAALIAAKDWSATPLGSRDRWPQELRTILDVSLANRFPVVFWWGPQYIQFYNDQYAPILGVKHPNALGVSGWIPWAEIWDVVGPQIDSVFGGGPSTWNEDLFLEMNRYGFDEETYFTFSYSALPDASAPNGIGGVIGTVQETTEKVIGERRMALLHDLAATAGETRSGEDECRAAALTFERYKTTIPFALIYLIDEAAGEAVLAASAGVPDYCGAPERIDLTTDSPWLHLLQHPDAVAPIKHLRDLFVQVPPGPWSEAPHVAVSAPISAGSAGDATGFLIAGVSPRLRFDERYRDFFGLVASQIGSAIASARAYEEERRRAEALAEIDRAKNVFFSNVSHEFRTPLTLMLGPLAELQRDANEQERPLVESAQRNALRLLKLVNTLLEFSRVEAGRADAVFAATDLGSVTAELCSVFQSAIESAGLEFAREIDLSEEVYVDRAMWEKIVLNLLSNALKFTLEGGIAVSLRAVEGCAELQVRDTGCGIGEADLPHLFERFRRVRNVRSRSHEGSGIGLALVKDLVSLHHGAVAVESTLGKGTVFTVRIPLGRAHLHAGAIADAPSADETAAIRDQYLAELQATVDNGPPAALAEAAEPATQARVLIVDDNADLREYLTRILSPQYQVLAARNGREALEVLEAFDPSLILSDVMMPEIDGIELLRAVRENHEFATTPFILLSARAGEDQSAAGLAHGADDYIAKPFSADDLLARVRANLTAAQVRDQSMRISARWFRSFADRLPFVLFRRDVTGAIAFTNSAWSEWLGLPSDPSSYTPEQLSKVIHPDDFKLAQGAARAAAASRSDYRFEYRVKHVDAPDVESSYRWYISSAQPQYTEGVFVGWTGYVLDIHDARLAANLEREFHALAEAVPVMVFSADATGAIDWYNNRWHEYTGQTIEQAKGWGWQSVPHPDDFPRMLEAWTQSLADGTPYEGEFRMRARDGSYRQFLTRILPMRDASGAVVRWYGSHIDIQAQTEALDRSKRVAETLQRVFLPDSLPHTPSVRFDGLYVAAERDALVGGDWYDAVVLPDGRYLISIGDVTGHGLSASVIAGSLRQAILGYALATASPSAILEKANTMLRFQHPEKYATALVGIVDSACSSFVYACAGHPAPLIAHKGSDAAVTLRHGGLPLGVADSLQSQEHTTALSPDDVLVLYTDGLTEFARDIVSAEERLKAAASQLAGDVYAAAPARMLKAAVMGDAPASDDIALIVAQFSAIEPGVASMDPAKLVKEWRFHSSDAYTAHTSRHELMKFVERFAADRDSLFTAELIIGEILANTVEHAPGLVEMKIDWSDALPVLTVRDTGPGLGDLLAELPADDLREKGRGLFLIHALAPDVRLSEAPGYGTELRITLPVAR